MDRPTLLAIDQGTTSSRAILFDGNGRPLTSAQKEFTQYYPRPAWVEHDPEEIWSTTVAVAREVIAGAAGPVAAVGIANQRETTLIWNRETGEPVYPAIVWQDRRTAEHCRALKAQGAEATVAAKTGLLIDPYFCGTKIAWILDNVDGARRRAEQGTLAFGTVDTFLIWRLTSGAVHATDVTNAARTLLFNIYTEDWDDELLDLLRVPRSVLPEVCDCAAHYGTAGKEVLGRGIAIGGVAGDQQAATLGQGCVDRGMMKSTYGTGAFAVMNTGAQAVASRQGLLTTIAYRLNGRTAYALEGSIFIAGAAVQWLRDVLRIIDAAGETEVLAQGLKDNAGVYLVPAFVGLGTPHWDPRARGAVFGLTRDTGIAHFARAALEAVCYQTRDLIVAMTEDAKEPIDAVRVDGGMVANDWLLQFLADVLALPVERPTVIETTALGAAYLAGLQAGLFESADSLRAHWRCGARFEPQMPANERERLIAGWDAAIASVREHSKLSVRRGSA
jgi:glycerol kinase